MTANEFIRVLGESLQDSMPIGEIRENVQYYKDYILEEIQRGRSEEAVMDELGDPRLIARTILDAKGYSGNFQGDSYDGSFQQREAYRDYRENAGGYGAAGSSYQQKATYDSGYGDIHVKRFDKWYHKVLFLLILLLVLVVGFTLIAGVISLILHFAVPVLLVYLVIRVARSILKG